MGFKCVHSSDVKIESMAESGAEGIGVRWLISEVDGAPNFAMRLFELELGGGILRFTITVGSMKSTF